MSVDKYLDKSNYNWKEGSRNYKNLLYKSKLKINKSSGDEVLFFIEAFLEKHGLEISKKNVNTIEKIFHHLDISDKELLLSAIEKEFEFS